MVKTHLADCEQCRTRLAELETFLDQVQVDVPERDAEYGAQVWQKIRYQLPARRRFFQWRFPRQWLIPVTAMATLLVLAFLMGRNSTPEAEPADLRERALLAAIGDHLEQTQVLLTDVANTRETDPYHGTWARRLVGTNRLVRQAAYSHGDTQLADFLDELEWTLLELANRDMDLEVVPAYVQEREEHKEIIFKIRVYENKVKKQRLTDQI